jgi:hypothetical protein
MGNKVTTPTLAAAATAADGSDEGVRAAALEAIAGELESLALDSTPPYTLDAVFARATALEAYAKCEPFFAQMRRLPDFDFARVERIQTYARALAHANALVNAHAKPPSNFDDLVAAGREVRELLFAVADLLVLRKEIQATVVAKLRAGSGLRDLIDDLTSLHTLLLPHAGAVVRAGDLEKASELVESLTAGLTSRDGDDPVLNALYNQRRKVCALLVRAYKDLQAAMGFLRRDAEDGHEYAPTLRITGTVSKAERGATPVKPMKDTSAASDGPAVESKPAGESRAAFLPEEPSDRPFEDRGE